MEPARFIAIAGDVEVNTSTCTVDIRTAAVRGLADYLRPIQLSQDNGRQDLVLKNVIEHRAEYEELADYPSAVVYLQGSLSTADGSDSLGPQNAESYRVDDGTLQINGEASGTLMVEIWCANPEERALFAMEVERLAHPCDWRSGFLMELPYYYNQRASYVLQSTDYQDSDQDVQRGYWKLVLSFQVGLAYATWRQFPNLDPRANITVT